MNFLYYLLPVSLLLLVGCAVPLTPRYSVSATNVAELRDLYGTSLNKIKVSEVTGSPNAIFCRIAAIQVPDELTMAAYIKNSFSDELKLAGVYSDRASREIRVKILKLDVNCNIGTLTVKSSSAHRMLPLVAKSLTVCACPELSYKSLCA